MKLLLGLLIWVCVGVGAISGVTAYFVPTTLDGANAYKSRDADLINDDNPDNGKSGEQGYVVLASAAGPEYPVGTELTPDVVTALSKADDEGKPFVKRVHLSEFSFDRWSHKYYFIASVIILGLCGLGQRALAKGGVLKKGAADPVDTLAAAIAEVRDIRDEVLGMSTDEGRLATIVHRVGELQQTHFANFPEARDVIVARSGLGKYATVMDAFAGGERKVNRAWSAAADGNLGESFESLELGLPMLEEAAKRLGS